MLSPAQKVPGQRAVAALSSPGQPSICTTVPGVACAQPCNAGAGSSEQAAHPLPMQMRKERWKYTRRLFGCSWGCRQISPTASSASTFPLGARGFNVSRIITNHLSCGFGFAQALALPPGHRQCEITTFAFPALDLLKCPRAPASLLGASKQSWRGRRVCLHLQGNLLIKETKGTALFWLQEQMAG